jgi:hypothetical protein
MRQPSYGQFCLVVRAAGLIPHTCGGGHWQIIGGGFLVNFYPETKRGPVFCVAGMKGVCGGMHAAIAAASKPVPADSKGERKGRGYHRRVKRSLLARDPHCYVCGAELNNETATLDHFIPLSKGGHEGNNNCRLACEGCNQEKGDKMPEASPVVRECVPVEVYEWV